MEQQRVSLMKVKYKVNNMAIVREFFNARTDGVNLYRTYSDTGMMLLQNETGIEYSDAVDIENAPYTYSESENPITDE